MPVTIASDERSFSKLKLSKTDLRARITQERLEGLGEICNENEIAEKVNFKNIMAEYVKKNHEKLFFSLNNHNIFFCQWIDYS